MPELELLRNLACWHSLGYSQSSHIYSQRPIKFRIHDGVDPFGGDLQHLQHSQLLRRTRGFPYEGDKYFSPIP